LRQAKAELVLSGLGLPECPRWFDGTLWVSDFHTKQLIKVPDGGSATVFAELPSRVGATGFLPDGSFYAISMEDRRVLHFADADSPDAAPTEVADLATLCPGWLNDLVVDHHGRAYVDDTGFTTTADGTAIVWVREEMSTSIILVGRDTEPRVVADGLKTANGMVVTPDGSTLITAETFATRVTAFTITEDGSLTDRRLFADLTGEAPNGITLDAEGGVWVASHTGRFLRVVDGGEVTDTIEVPGGPSYMAVACVLGGRDGRQLFMTSTDYWGSRMPNLWGPNPKSGRVDVVTVDVPGVGSP
jgi:sugar lactone lactonase YvrE